MACWVWRVLGAMGHASWVEWWLLGGGALLLFLYWLGTRSHDHFRRRGMPFARPLPFVGSMAPVLLGRLSMADWALHLYRAHRHLPASGFFEFARPKLLLRDPDLIRAVTVKAFDHFVDHQQFNTERAEPMFARNLLGLTGQEWRDMRATLSPAFTTSKMRNIFSLINLSAEQMVNYLKKTTKDSPNGVFEVEMKDFSSRLTNDIIASSAFGIECDSLRQPDNEFYRMGRDLTNIKGLKVLILFGHILCPKIMEFFGIRLNSNKVQNFFHNTVHETINERQKKGIFRPDMLQLLMQAREGILKAEAGDEPENIKGAKLKTLSDVDITAQSIIFFFAGFHTVAMTISFCSYACAKHPEIQERVQREVDEVFDKCSDKISYDAAQELRYTEMFINEVLRLYLAVPALDRRCTQDFTLPAHGGVPAYTVRKGEMVWIPVHPLHVDPEHWEDPHTFDPERFSDENKHRIKPFTFIPFGAGPRSCIGSRFALMEVKVVLASILRHFKFLATDKTPKKLEYATRDFGGGIKGGFWVGIADRRQ
ncbi:hypothetical protein R5R35_010767 [Gryllus longicercus]|uniref:Cytochrome P450 n=1 Tax=Gryllus longicercus TaxID=2509291 RepID=A0AAN9VS00_9ORTH